MAVNRRKRRERYSRNTEGWNAQGFFGDVDSIYPTTPTLADFLYDTTNAGQIGLFEDDGLLKINDLLPGQKFIIAQKNTDGTLKKSTELVEGQFTVTKTPFLQSAAQKDIVSPLNINIVGGLQEFVLSVRLTTPANQPFPVMEGRAIVRSGTPTDYDIAAAIVSDINNSYDFERNADNAFAAINVVGQTPPLGAAATLGTSYTLTNGSPQMYIAGADATAEMVAGTYIQVDEFAPEPPVIFQIVSSAYDAASNATNVTLDKSFAKSGDAGFQTGVIGNIWIGDQATVIDPNVIGIEIVGQDDLTHFTTSVSEDLGDAVITTTQPWVFGSGNPEQVAHIEDECAVFDGWTTINEAWVTDFGAPDLWVDDSLTGSEAPYALYIFESLNRIIPSAGAPQNQTLMKANLIIAAVEGSTLESNLDDVLQTELA